MGQKESWIWVVEVRLGMEVNEVLVGLMEGRAHSGGSGPGTPYRPSRKAIGGANRIPSSRDEMGEGLGDDAPYWLLPRVLF